jgi:hypothetical protein
MMDAMDKIDFTSTQNTDFGRDFLNPETPISGIGTGSVGGKAQGLINLRNLLFTSFSSGEFRGISVTIPSFAVIRTDVFDAFMQLNDLYEIACSDLSDDRIAHAFLKADLPFEILGDLRALIERVHTPLAIRSSSLLEDTKNEPFAGIYETKMIPNNQFDPDERFRRLAEAIKFVYASTFTKRAKDYRTVNHHKDSDEKMAVIIQEVVGKRHHTLFYPELSGVARSYNYYAVRPARPEDGVVNLALGLGKTIVDGSISWVYSPARPSVEPPVRSAEELVDLSQREFWAINMGEPIEYDPINETEYMLLENLTIAERDGSLDYLASTYDLESDRLSMGVSANGPRVLTFAPLLAANVLPLSDLVSGVLKICEESQQSAVEIEFAMTFNPHRFNLLQARSMIVPIENIHVEDDELVGDNVLLASENVLGNGMIDTIRDIIYVKPDVFTLANSVYMVPELAQLNHIMISLGRPYLLIALGRLGTNDPWLGIPANWGDVSGAKVIVEATQSNVIVDLSQGSHYFHNIISQDVKYFTLAYSSHYQIDWDWLKSLEILDETEFLARVELCAPLRVKVDGKHCLGVVFKK